MEMSSCNDSGSGILVVLEKQTTLYMRPAAMLTKIANQFESDVFVENENKRANGKSLLDIITLGIGTGDNFSVFAVGRDASKAIHSIKVFFKRFFIDGVASDEIVEDCCTFNKCIGVDIEHNREEEMKRKKQTAVKQEQTQTEVKQDKTKVQTFVWPLSGNVNAVHLAGDFNSWIPEAMLKRDNGFHATVNLEPGVYQYKFVVDGEWQIDPSAGGNAQNDFGTSNSVLLVE